MSDSFRAWIRGILDGQLRVPKGLRRQVIDTVSREYAQRQRRRSIPTAIALALFVLLVGSLFFGLPMSRFPGTAGPASSLQPATSPSATLTPSATSSPNGCMAASETASGCLTVTPNAGPVGTVVVLEGTGCSYTGRTAYLVFEGEGGSETGTVGAIDIPYRQAFTRYIRKAAA